MAADYQRNVFINCPFDEAYSPLLRAITFAIVDCGFNPRCALEKSDSSEIRIQKIYRIIKECGLSVHDLSRTQLDQNTKLPRFNMPLELGIFLGAKFLGNSDQQRKVCLVFDEQPHRYQMYLSDVAGQDIQWHSNDPKAIVHRVRNWLASVVEAHLPSGSVVWDHYATFQGELRDNCERVKQRPAELTYNDMLRHIVSFRNEYKEMLDIQNIRRIVNPSAQEIKGSLRSITLPSDDPFVILEKGANGLTYIQAFLDKTSSWTLEYQDGHLEQHFQASNLSTEKVVDMFLAFAAGDEAWRNSVRWKQIEI